MIVVNADDFGYDSATNEAILECFRKGFCSSATVMPNMPGFEGACQIIRDHNLIKAIGIHFVLSEGVPMTDGIKGCRRFCNPSGIFNLDRKSRYLLLDSGERKAVASELRAQISKCRQNGISIAHADSHSHAHEEWGIAAVVIAICREAGIPYLRKARNCGPERALHKRIYRHLLNSRIEKAGLSRTKHFGSAKDALFLLKETGATGTPSLEIMVHPAYDRDGSLIDATDGADMADIIRQLRAG